MIYVEIGPGGTHRTANVETNPVLNFADKVAALPGSQSGALYSYQGDLARQTSLVRDTIRTERWILRIAPDPLHKPRGVSNHHFTADRYNDDRAIGSFRWEVGHAQSHGWWLDVVIKIEAHDSYAVNNYRGCHRQDLLVWHVSTILRSQSSS